MNSYSIVLLLIISISLMNDCSNAFGGRKTLEKNYISFDVNSYLSTSCKSPVQGRTRPGSLEVKHKYGHCSKLGLNASHIEPPSLEEILERDETRVASIHNKRSHHTTFHTKKSSTNANDVGVSKATVSAQPGTIVGFSNYVVSVGLGTPTKYLTLAFDTGSSLTWTQCQPCAGQCYPQRDPIFDPSASTSYSNLSCNSAQCSQLSNAYLRGCTKESACVYFTGYGDHSNTSGLLGNELLTLTPNDTISSFTFGCGEDNEGNTFGDTAGILGLGRDTFSVVSQTAEKYGKYFSYCLPTQSGSNGHLTFGNGGAPGNLAFTPLGNDPQDEYYFVNIVSISVGGTQLAISPTLFQSGGGSIIDSGTIITRLPPTAYTALRDTFKQQMSTYTSAPAFSLLDTCYDFSNLSTIQYPQISFMFDGNVKVNLAFEGVLLRVGQTIFCLAFTANNADTDTVIYGNLQQQTFEVAYDVAGGLLGFGPAGCT